MEGGLRIKGFFGGEGMDGGGDREMRIKIPGPGVKKGEGGNWGVNSFFLGDL